MYNSWSLHGKYYVFLLSIKENRNPYSLSSSFLNFAKVCVYDLTFQLDINLQLFTILRLSIALVYLHYLIVWWNPECLRAFNTLYLHIISGLCKTHCQQVPEFSRQLLVIYTHTACTVTFSSNLLKRLKWVLHFGNFTS